MTNLTKKQETQLNKQYSEYLLKQLSDEIYAITDDPRNSILAIAENLEKAKPYLPAKEYIKFRMDLHKLTHGEKSSMDVNVKTEQAVKLNIGVDLKALLPQDEVIEAEFTEDNTK